MELSLNYTFLEVDDHDAALAFYRDTLGLEIRQDVAMEGARWLTVATAEFAEFTWNRAERPGFEDARDGGNGEGSSIARADASG